LVAAFASSADHPRGGGPAAPARGRPRGRREDDVRAAPFLRWLEAR
jgi:hypothetical protein